MGCSISCERGEPEAEIVEEHDVSSTYLFGCNIWCGLKPFARQVNHDQLPNNEPADMMLPDLRPVSQPTPQDVFAAEWQRTGGRAVAQQTRQEPIARAERSHQISSRTHLPNFSALLELGLENRHLQLRGEQGSRESLSSPGSQSEVDRPRHRIRQVSRALENSPQNANSEHERLIRHGRARPSLASPAPSRLQSEMENCQQPNQGDRREPHQRPSAPYPLYRYPNSPPPAYSIRTPE